MDQVLALQWVKFGVVLVIILALLWMSKRQPAIARHRGWTMIIIGLMIIACGDAGSATNQRFNNADLRWSTRPLPWGGSIEYESHAVRFSVPADSTVTIHVTWSSIPV